MTEIIGGLVMHKGIDTSKYNAVINWAALKAQDIEFALIRSGQGPKYVDPLCLTHIANAKAAGIHYGIYHFYDYRWPSGALHFDNMKAVVGKDFGTIPATIDFETLYDYSGKKQVAIPLPARNTVYSELMKFGELLKHETACKPMLYIGNLISYLKPDQAFMDVFDLYFANWNAYEHIGSFAPWKKWLCWQRIGDVALAGQTGVWDIDYVKDADWQYFISPIFPTPAPVTFQNTPLKKRYNYYGTIIHYYTNEA